MNTTILKDSIKNLFEVMNTLQAEYKSYNKKFTLDGRLVGDLGEIVCAEHYGIELFDKVEPIYDGIIKGTSKKVQIKTTFHDALTFPCNKEHIPEYYLGIKLYEDGTFEEIFNGKGQYIFDELLKNKKATSNGLFSISINQLKKLNQSVESKDRVGKKFLSGKVEI